MPDISSIIGVGTLQGIWPRTMIGCTNVLSRTDAVFRLGEFEFPILDANFLLSTNMYAQNS